MIQFRDVADVSDSASLFAAFFREVRVGRYLADYKLDLARAVEQETVTIADYAARGTLILAFDARDELLGFIGFHLSSWDTELFGQPYAIIQHFLVKEPALYCHLDVARALLLRFHEWAAHHGVRVAVVKLDTGNYTPILAVQESGYQYFECSTYLTADRLPQISMSRGDLDFRYARETDREALRNLVAKHFFRRSHFFLDPGFPVDRVEALYAKWVDTALDRQQTFVVIEHEGAICGVFIYEMDDRTTRFGRKYAVWKLADVDSRVRGKGLGMRLFHATVMSAADQGADAIDSSLAVHNVASQNIHIRLGFRLITSVYTFHRWFEPKEAR